MSDSAPCRKCESQISPTADRCPECGFEPSVGIIGGLVAWIGFSLGLLCLVIAVSAVLVIPSGYPLTWGLGMAAGFGFVGLLFTAGAYSRWRERHGTAAQEPGPNRVTRFGQLDDDEIEELVDESTLMSSTGLTAGVLLGIGLGLAAFPLATTEYEVVFGVVAVASIAVLIFSLLADINRINDAQGTGFRRWAYVAVAAIPAFGLVAGLAWLVRKRLAFGSVFA